MHLWEVCRTNQTLSENPKRSFGNKRVRKIIGKVRRYCLSTRELHANIGKFIPY